MLKVHSRLETLSVFSRLALLPAIAGPALAQPVRSKPVAPLTDDAALSQSWDALQRQDFKRAADLLRPLARKGNPIAQHDMGVMFAPRRRDAPSARR